MQQVPLVLQVILDLPVQQVQLERLVLLDQRVRQAQMQQAYLLCSYLVVCSRISPYEN